MNITELEKRIKNIEERNKKVETNKAWETSFTRKVALIIITYIAVGITLLSMGNSQPWFNAFIPSLGFFISTLTLTFVKDIWIKKIHKPR